MVRNQPINYMSSPLSPSYKPQALVFSALALVCVKTEVVVLALGSLCGPEVRTWTAGSSGHLSGIVKELTSHLHSKRSKPLKIWAKLGKSELYIPVKGNICLMADCFLAQNERTIGTGTDGLDCHCCTMPAKYKFGITVNKE